MVHAATNTGLWGFFVAPWMRDAVLNPVIDNALDSRELLSLVMGDSTGASQTRFSAAAFEAGRNPASAGGISSIFLDNLQKNAVPAMFKIVGSNIAKKVITKSGVTRSLNRITRGIGMQDLVRW